MPPGALLLSHESDLGSCFRAKQKPDMRPPFGDALTSESALVLLNANAPGISSVHEAEQVIVLSLERGGEAPEESPGHETVDPLLGVRVPLARYCETI